MPLERPKPRSARWVLWRVREIVRREGWLSLWFRMLALLGYRRNRFMICRLDANRRPNKATVPTKLEMLAAADAGEYVAFRRGAKLSDIDQRLNQGFRCYIARCNDRLVSATWVARRWAILWALDAVFELDNDQIYVFDSYTLREFRGHRIQAAIFTQLAADALRNGCKHAVLFVEPQNRPNIVSRQRLGFAPKGLVVRLKIGLWCWYFSHGSAPDMRRRLS